MGTTTSVRFRQAPLLYGMFSLQIVTGAGIAMAPGNLVALVVNAQVLNGVITPMLLTYVLILANRSTVLGKAKNGPIFKTVATVCVGIVASLSFSSSSKPSSGCGDGNAAASRRPP